MPCGLIRRWILAGGGDSPYPGPIHGDFSVRWTGYVVITSTESYVFSVQADDGVRLWIGDFLVADNWSSPDFQQHDTAPLLLTAGQKYSIKMEMYDNGGGATARLRWHTVSGSIEDQPIPGSQLEPPAGPMPLIAGRAPNDMCVPNVDLNNGGSVDNQYFAGTPVPPKEVISGGVEALSKISLDASEVAGYRVSGTYRVLIVPVGYSDEEITARESKILEVLETVYQQLGLPVTFSYLKQSMPIPVDEYGSVMRTDGDAMAKLKEMIPSLGKPAPHMLILDVNIGGRGYAGDGFVVIQREAYLFTGIHELGHEFGLSDGYYDTFYSYGGLHANTEWYLVDSSGNPLITNADWKMWLGTHYAKFITSPYVCFGEPITKPEGAAESIMGGWWDDDKIFQGSQLNPAVFTDFQRWLMKRTIAEILKKTP